MSFDFAAIKREQLAHLVSMALVPGAKDQAWRSAKDLAKQFPGEFGDLPDLLKAEVKRMSEVAA